MDALQAFAEPRRREILALVWQRELTASDIAAQFKVSGPAISQHLRVLRETGLVHERRLGTKRLYSARPEGIEAVRAYVDRFWDQGLERLKQAVTEDSGSPHAERP